MVFTVLHASVTYYFMSLLTFRKVIFIVRTLNSLRESYLEKENINHFNFMNSLIISVLFSSKKMK